MWVAEAQELAQDGSAAASLPPAEDTVAKSQQITLLMTILYVAIFIIGVVGNLCNCLVIADSRNRYMKTATNYYLFSLSVSDLFLLTFGLPHDLANLWHPSSYLFSEFVCLSRGWISEASAYASILIIVTFTVERYLAICHPLKAHTLSRLSRSIKIIMLIWVLASSCALIVVMQYGLETVTERLPDGRLVSTTQCTVVQRNSKIVFSLSLVIFFILPFGLITCLYVKLGYHLCRKSFLIRQNQLNKQERLTSLQSSSNSQHQVLSELGGSRRASCSSEKCDPTWRKWSSRRWLSTRRRPHPPSTAVSYAGPEEAPTSARLLEVATSQRPVIRVPVTPAAGSVGLSAASCKVDSDERRTSSDTCLSSRSEASGKPSSQPQVAKSVPGPQDLPEGGRANVMYSNPSAATSTVCERPEPSGASRTTTQPEIKLALNSTARAASMQSVIKMLVSVVVMFFICWAPFHAQRLMAIYLTNPTAEQLFIYNLLEHVSGVSYYISAIVNPILYSLFSVKFRQAFHDTFGSMRIFGGSGRHFGPTSSRCVT